MRSRYAAYARGLVDYIIATTDPAGPQWDPDTEGWRARILAFCQDTRFEGLRILDAPPPGTDEGFVTFEATLIQDGRNASFTERSRFVRVEGTWRYSSGENVGGDQG